MYVRAYVRMYTCQCEGSQMELSSDILLKELAAF